MLDRLVHSLANIFAFKDALGIIVALLVIEAAILFLAEWRRTKAAFKYIPSMFWIYFLPMVVSNVGLLPAGDPIFDLIRKYCLPACLVLLILSVDVKAIAKLGKVALAVMLAGSAGIVLGGPVVLLIFQHWLPAESWKGFAALSASWTGGSANMIAVKEGLQTPPNIFSPMVVVDTICPYAWMGLLIFLSSYQAIYDRWNRSRMSITDELVRKAELNEQQSHPITLTHAAVIIGVAAAFMFLSLRVAAELPPIAMTAPPPIGRTVLINASAWGLILATGFGIGLSFTPARKLESFGASRIGYFLLYFVLASIGAGTSVKDLGTVPLLIAAGCVWIVIHAIFLVVAGRIFKAPMSLLAAASQANVGGPASTPVVAGVYLPALAPVGLLLAIFGNIIGTYLGFVCAALCKFVSSL